MIFASEVHGTGLVFPGTVTSPDGKELKLMAIGVRKMTMLKFKLYSIGLYLEQDGIEALKGIRSVIEAQDKIISNGFDWALRIVPVRNGSMSHLRDALVRRLKLPSSDITLDPLKKHIDEFASLFPNAPMQMGYPLTFFWNRKGGLQVFRQDQSLGSLSDSLISGKLLNIYLDEKNSTIPEMVLDLKDSLANNST